MSAVVSRVEAIDAMLATECAGVPKIACAYVSPARDAFVIQTVIARHEIKDGHFLVITPKYAIDSATTKTVASIVDRVKRTFPGVAGHAVSYRFDAHGWVEAYRK